MQARCRKPGADRCVGEPLDPDGRKMSANERSHKGLAFLFYEGYIEVVPRSAASPVRSGSTAVLAGELMGNHCRLIPEMIE